MKLKIKEIRCDIEPGARTFPVVLRAIRATRYVRKQFPIFVEKDGNVFRVVANSDNFHALKACGATSFYAQVIEPTSGAITLEKYFVPRYRVRCGHHRAMLRRQIDTHILANVYNTDGTFDCVAKVAFKEIDT